MEYPFPEGQTITVGNTHINCALVPERTCSDIDGDRQKLVVGERQGYFGRRAVITTLGAITLIDTVFQINLSITANGINRGVFRYGSTHVTTGAGFSAEPVTPCRDGCTPHITEV